MGKGVAIRKGLEEAAKLGCSHAITMDADGQHKADNLPAFFEAIKNNPHAIIIGARDFSVPNVPKGSRFGRSFSRFWMFVQTGVDVSDMQSGFRAYPIEVLKMLKCHESRYSYEIEIIVKAAWAGFSIQEIPIDVYYPPCHKRVSHFRCLEDNIRISLLNARLTIRALLPLPYKRQILKFEGNLSICHPVKTFRKLILLSSPSHLAKSAGWSVFVSSLPIFGINAILLLYVINAKNLNRLCALVMMPLAWPPILPGIAIILGHRIIYGEWLTEFSVQTLGYEAGYRICDWIAGSLFLAPVVAIMIYFFVYLFTIFLHKQTYLYSFLRRIFNP